MRQPPPLQTHPLPSPTVLPLGFHHMLVSSTDCVDVQILYALYPVGSVTNQDSSLLIALPLPSFSEEIHYGVCAFPVLRSRNYPILSCLTQTCFALLFLYWTLSLFFYIISGEKKHFNFRHSLLKRLCPESKPHTQ